MSWFYRETQRAPQPLLHEKAAPRRPIGFDREHEVVAQIEVVKGLTTQDRLDHEEQMRQARDQRKSKW